MLNIGDISRLNGKRYPDKVALVGTHEGLTYRELDEASNELAHALLQLKVEKGDRVALLSHNRIEYAIVTQAAAKIGVILVPINFRLTSAELSFILADCEPKVLITERGFREELAAALTNLPVSPVLIFLDEGRDGSDRSLASVRAGSSAVHPPIEVDEHDPAVIMYTSGTTGRPKGVVVNHRTYLRMYYAQAIEAQLEHEDVYLLALPMFHAAGMNLALQQCLFMGSTGIVHRGSFDPPAIMDMIEKHWITVVVMVPTTIAMLAAHPAAADFDGSSLRRVFYGAMPVTPAVQQAAKRVFPNAGLVQIYGSTETGMATILRSEDHRDYIGFTGREALLSEIRVVDELGSDVAVGEIGEVITRQAALGMSEYWRNPEATVETVRDGWIHSGDLARVERDGFITIVDRMKDMVISGGENVYPKEVEAVLLKHPAVRDAAVFGIPHDIYGEAVAAAVCASGMQEENGIIEFCRSQLPGYKVPKIVMLVETLPRNSSDKIQKHVLREMYRANAGEAKS